MKSKVKLFGYWHWFTRRVSGRLCERKNYEQNIR
jgi:hypothetical protein